MGNNARHANGIHTKVERKPVLKGNLLITCNEWLLGGWSSKVRYGRGGGFIFNTILMGRKCVWADDNFPLMDLATME